MRWARVVSPSSAGSTATRRKESPESRGTGRAPVDHDGFLRFIRKAEQQSDPSLDLHFILDNYATHKHPKVHAWPGRHPRVHFHFLPTSSSWLNLVERFFRDLSQRQLKRLAVNSVAELIDAITVYIEARNRDPRPFVWTASVNQILSKVRKGNRTLETLH